MRFCVDAIEAAKEGLIDAVVTVFMFAAGTNFALHYLLVRRHVHHYRLDEEFRKTGRLRPLHGIPVIVKDNYDTAGLQTTAGSLALKGSLPPDDAYQVHALREAGALG